MSAPPDLSGVSVVVLSHNRKDVVARNVAALVAMAEETGCELIVIDNASTDGSVEMIATALAGHPHARLIANSTNLGVARGRNAGWRASSRDYILNIDDDTLITPEAAAGMLSVMRLRPELAIVSPRILHAATGAAQLACDASEGRLSNFHGACHLVRRAALNIVGFNDEGCTFGGEELDLSIRMRAAGFEVGYVGDVAVLHDSLARTGEAGRRRRERWIYNFTRIFYKHFPLRAALPFSLRYLASHLVSGARDHGPIFALNIVGSALRGLRDGRRAHKAVPDAVVQFYRNPNLRPEFGNRPIRRKLVRKGAATSP